MTTFGLEFLDSICVFCGVAIALDNLSVMCSQTMCFQCMNSFSQCEACTDVHHYFQNFLKDTHNDNHNNNNNNNNSSDNDNNNYNNNNDNNNSDNDNNNYNNNNNNDTTVTTTTTNNEIIMLIITITI